MTVFTLAVVVAAVSAVRGMWSPCGLSMLSSLNPVSETARGNRFWLTALWYVAGASVGGALLGAGGASAAFGWGRTGASDTATWAIVLGAALVALASDTGVFARSLPDHPRQVDERWLVKYRRWIYAGGYGVQIGAGFATYIMTAAVYLVAVLAILTGDPAEAFTVCLVFGVVRGLTILVAAGARTPDGLRAAHRRINALAATSLQICVALSAAVAVTAGHVLAGPLVAIGVAALVAVLTFAPRARPKVASP
ncbi:MAG TPA: hypothetical protein VGH43_14515 [Jatrophihabitans sp.]|jgi:hypothetical protein